jgi:cysteine desulfurase
MDLIYLDHNASSPLDPEVLEAMCPYLLAHGNAESHHTAGRAIRRAWEDAKETVAQILGADPSEVIFTSGGTEANNLAISGLTKPSHEFGHIVATPIEHPAVSRPLERLEQAGFRIARPQVSSEGIADAELMRAAFCPETCLATLILAHNETGAIQPVADLVALAADTDVLIHTDAVQAVGRIPVSFRGLGVTTLALSAHKFHGPVGVGALLVRRGMKLIPDLVGGGQQDGRRAGTPAVGLAVGLAKALEQWASSATDRISHWTALRTYLEAGLKRALGHEAVVLNGPGNAELRLPQTLNVGFPGVDGNALLLRLDQAGVAASLGAACASGSTQPSPSFLAMCVPEDYLRSSVRFSFGADTTEADVEEALRRIVFVVQGIARI